MAAGRARSFSAIRSMSSDVVPGWKRKTTPCRSMPRMLEEAGVRAAVDGEGGAGDEPGVLAAEEGGEHAEVLGAGEVPGGHRGGRSAEVVAVQAPQAVGLVRARQHRVDRHAVPGDLAGQR